ncbi:MAG: phosphoribosylamine--glycine ligase [Euryarchaeota archaeon]|nr:phosphoribosylamine--glycine ligase [Euryarchaeota archaeon]
MKVLIVGGGAREHCIVAALARDGAELFCAMKNRNPGLARLSKDVCYVSETDVPKVVEYARSKGIGMAVIGPEAPLEKGIVDELAKAGIHSVGPTKSCARLETSKSFTRGLLEKYKIPGNPKHSVFRSPDGLREFIAELGEYVIKDEGLAGGKGVRLSGEHLISIDDGVKYAEECISKSGAVVVEEKFVGEEFSVQCLCDGRTIAGSPLAQDHKRAYEGDRGPNTGGMGSYSDANHLLPFLGQKEYDDAIAITQKVCDALRKECDEPYKGVMYGGFIATKDGIRLIEYNARYADPEVMNVLPLLESSVLELFEAVIDGKLKPCMGRYARKATVCKYVVPKGYGVKSEAGASIAVDERGIEKAGALLYYASVNEAGGKVLTTTSRSLAIVGISDTIGSAEKICEDGLRHVKGDVFVRHDIGTRSAIERKGVRMAALKRDKP